MMKVLAAGMLVALVAMFTGSCGGLGSSTSPLPEYTPTAGDLYNAYTTALDKLAIAQDNLQDARDRILSQINTVPDMTLDAIQEARDCATHIDDLTNDPRDFLTSVQANLSDPKLASARDAPRGVAHDLAAAHVASPANRNAVESALDAHIRNQLLDRPTPDDPVFQAYLTYLNRGDNSAFAAYLSALDGINDAYFPFDERLTNARTNLVFAFLQLPDKSGSSDCARILSELGETYERVFESYFPALLAYLDGVRSAIDRYARALERARVAYESE